MKSFSNSSAVRTSVQAQLSGIAPSALTLKPRTIHERLPSEEHAFDSLTDGGLPVGALTELVGGTGSGRTSMASAFVAAAMREGKVVAWVDVGNAFDPESAVLNGFDLSRLLWVRCRTSRVDVELDAVAHRSDSSGSATTQPVRDGGCPHPRSEGRGMPEAIGAMLKAHGGLYDRHAQRETKCIGTPGAPNRSLARVTDREEQVATDRVSRRHNLMPFRPRCAQPLRKQDYTTALQTGRHRPRHFIKPWQSIDRALRSVDLLLHAGGFGIIVLDLGDIPADIAWNVPLATWFRFRAGCERSRTIVLLLTQHPCARSSAELVVRLGMGQMIAENCVVSGFSFQAEIERQRFKSNVMPIRKSPQSENPGRWRGRSAWAI